MSDVAVRDANVAGVSDSPIKFAVISGATSGDNTLVAAVTGKKIRVISLVAIPTATVAFRLESGAGGTALTGVAQLTTVGIVLPHNPSGWLETAAATLLNMELGAGTQVSGCLTYQEV
jgi:hypothetical protein